MPPKFDFETPDFPVLLPDTGAAQYLVLFLHGYGSNGEDLIGLGDIFNQVIPQAVYLSPNAPTPTGFGGYQWFPISDLSNRELELGTISVAPHLHSFIDQALEYYKIPQENLIIAGFSQGAMITLHIGPERPVAPLAILGYSGALTAADTFKERINSKPPVFLCHGGNDDVVDPVYTHKAYDLLQAHDFFVEKHIIPNYPHTIPPEGLRATLSFLDTHIKPKASH